MNYKNFFIILILIIPFQSFSSENDEYLSLETWKVYGQSFLSACLKADYAKNNESINEVLRKVRRDVKEHTKNKQIPEEYSNLTDKIVLSD